MVGGEGTGWVHVWQPGVPIQCAKCLEVGHRQGDLEATPLKLCQCWLSSWDKKRPRGLSCPHGAVQRCILNPCFVLVVLTQHSPKITTFHSPASLYLQTEGTLVQQGI